MDEVIANLNPQNYATLNSVASPAQQVTDSTKTAEDGVYATITSLASIVTTTVTDGNLTNLPAK